MLHATLVLAAEAVEKSKTPFYIFGGALAAWAVVLGAAGLTRPSFPTGTAERGVIAITTVLVLGSMITAVVTG